MIRFHRIHILSLLAADPDPFALNPDPFALNPDPAKDHMVP
jgi:hypothetical protein